MRIEFDTGNALELAAVASLIAVLRGDRTLPTIGEIEPGDADPAEAFASTAPVPAAEAFAPPVPAAPVVSSGVAVDTSGLPWDARIHSGPADKKPQNADGTWRKRRGVDDATVAAVEAELRQVMGAPAPAPTVDAGEPQAFTPPPLAAPAVPTPPVAPADTVFGAGAADSVSSAPPVPAAPFVPAPVAATEPPSVAPPPAAPASGGLSFADLMRKITAMQTAGSLTVEQTQQISASLGITGVRDLMHRPDLIPSFDALLPTAA